MRRSLKTARLPPYQPQISGWAANRDDRSNSIELHVANRARLSVVFLAKPNRTFRLAITFLWQRAFTRERLEKKNWWFSNFADADRRLRLATTGQSVSMPNKLFGRITRQKPA